MEEYRRGITKVNIHVVGRMYHFDQYPSISNNGNNVHCLGSVLHRYVNEVTSRDELPADATMGRRLMDIVNTAATHMQTEKLDSLVKNSLRVT